MCLTLCDSMDCSPPGSVLGIFQARTLEWVTISFSKWLSTGDLPNPGTEPVSPALAGGFFTTESAGKPIEDNRWVPNKLQQRVCCRAPSLAFLLRLLIGASRRLNIVDRKSWKMVFTLLCQKVLVWIKYLLFPFFFSRTSHL